MRFPFPQRLSLPRPNPFGSFQSCQFLFFFSAPRQAAEFRIFSDLMSSTKLQTSLRGHDVKTLTLFFIDQVSKIRDDSRTDNRGEYLQIFDEEYETYLKRAETQFKLNEYRYLFPKDVPTIAVREGYFTRDKNQSIAELTYSKNGEPLSKS